MPNVATPTRSSADDALRAILDLAGQGLPPSSYYRQVLVCIARSIQSPYAAIEVYESTEVIRHEHCEETTDPDLWRETVDSALTDAMSAGRPQARLFADDNPDMRLALVSLPIQDATGTPTGAIVLVAVCPDRKRAQAMLAKANPLAQLASLGAEGISAPIHEQRETGPSIQTLRKAAGYGSQIELAYAITNNLRNHSGSEQVAIGIVHVRRVDVAAVSGLDDVAKRNPGVRQIQSAMEECLDHRDTIVCQLDEDLTDKGASSGHRLHRQWHHATGEDCVVSIPLRASERIVAILSLRRSGHEPFTTEQLSEYLELVEPYMAAIDLVNRANRRLLSHAAVSARESAASLITKRGQRIKQVLVGAAALATLWLFFGKLDYKITVPCVLSPAEVRHLGAPGDAALQQAFFIAGDRIRKDDVLCEFDRTEFELEVHRIEGQLAMARLDENRTMAAGQAVEYGLARANIRQLRASLEIVHQRIEDTVIRSPFDGVIVSGDLRDRTGDVFVKGETLFQVSPETGWRLELQIPESEVTDVEVNMRGHFASRARPEEVHEFQVVLLRPDAEIYDGHNVFVAEAKADVQPDWIRSGMEGVAKVEVGRRRVWWVAFHRVGDYVRLHFWL